MIAISEVIQQERLKLEQKQYNQSCLTVKNSNISVNLEKANELLKDYMPNKQVSICSDKSICFFGSCPTLIDLRNRYGTKLPLIWLVGQIVDLVSFSNCKNIINDAQVKELARIINNEYGYYKLTELMYFFYQFKNGHYSDFYGSVSPISITKSLQIFRHERLIEYENYNNEQNEINRQEGLKGCITKEEWIKTYKNKQN